MPADFDEGDDIDAAFPELPTGLGGALARPKPLAEVLGTGLEEGDNSNSNNSSKSDGTSKKKTAESRQRAPIPKLDAELLRGPRGIPSILSTTRRMRFASSKGNEAKNLKLFMASFEEWAQALYPRLKFADFVQRSEKLCREKRMRMWLLGVRELEVMGTNQVEGMGTALRPDSDDSKSADLPELVREGSGSSSTPININDAAAPPVMNDAIRLKLEAARLAAIARREEAQKKQQAAAAAAATAVALATTEESISTSPKTAVTIIDDDDDDEIVSALENIDEDPEEIEMRRNAVDMDDGALFGFF